MFQIWTHNKLFRQHHRSRPWKLVRESNGWVIVLRKNTTCTTGSTQCVYYHRCPARHGSPKAVRLHLKSKVGVETQNMYLVDIWKLIETCCDSFNQEFITRSASKISHVENMHGSYHWHAACVHWAASCMVLSTCDSNDTACMSSSPSLHCFALHQFHACCTAWNDVGSKGQPVK